MIATTRTLVLYTLLWFTGASAYTSEEQALVQFAGQLSNFREVAADNEWHGWGLDNNTLCPSTQISTTQELLCEPGYPGGIDQASQSWTGVTCTPNGHVVCLSLPGYNLIGNVSLLLELAPLQSVQFLNVANNSLTGSLPSNLPSAFRASAHSLSALAVMYLSNNSIFGSLPASWGDEVTGWGVVLRRLYLSNNNLTGQLPQLWSDSNSLYDLGRLDLFGNEMTGSIPWSRSNMPSLDNLVLLPGNQFCGEIADEYQGVVRNFTGNYGPFQVLANVTSFDTNCAIDVSRPAHVGTHNGIAGSVLAATAGAVLAVLLWFCIWRPKPSSSFQSYAGLMGSQKPNWRRWFTQQPSTTYHVNELGSQLSTDKLSTVVGDCEILSGHDSLPSNTHSSLPSNNLSSRDLNIKTSLVTAHSMIASPSQPVADLLCASASTAFFTSRPVITEASNLWPISWPSLPPMQQNLLIPAPLWQDVEISSDNISIAQTAAGTDWILGQGSYGVVYKGIKDGVHEVAIKIFTSVTTSRDLELLQTEIAVLRSCNNRNIVHFYGVSFKQADAWLVMELLEKGNLYNALAFGKGLCTWYNRGAGIALDIAKGLHFLHSHHVMHLDLKSPNILLAQDGTAKIADVGLSRMFTTRSLPIAKNTGTFHWMAPELISAGRCTEKADIFSFGVVLYEIFTAEQPIRGRMKPVRAPEHCPQLILDLMTQCRDERPENRPAATDIIRMISNNLPSKTKLRYA